MDIASEREDDAYGPRHHRHYYPTQRRPSYGAGGSPFRIEEGYAHTPDPPLSPPSEEEERNWPYLCSIPALSLDDGVRCVVGAIALLLLGWIWVGIMYPPYAYE
ncbi:hypothetical protein PG999_013921 [Apiospora kogelbergensis]|uniref:Transmembrane protein n=2 Tax=Apiospora kogelbergensis TaxID=1337665 RepID=A0AAW0QLV8_9PEZI